MEVWVTKVIALIFLLVVTIFTGLLPVKLIDYVQGSSQNGSSKRLPLLAMLNCFAGGAFLGTLMLHLQPHLQDLTDKVALTDRTIPLAEILTAAGFFLILIIEQIFVHISNKQQANHGIKSPGSLDTALEDISEEHTDSMLSTDDVMKSYGSTDLSLHSLKNVKHRRVILLLVALSTHSLFEGLAIGLQDSKSLVWTMSVAIAFHKAIISFSTGVQLVKNYHPDSMPVVIGIVAFSVMSPLGTAIGTTIQALGGQGNDRTLSIVILVLQGLAAGTFMFITFVEILVKHLRSSGAPLSKTVAVLLGFTCLLVVLVFDADH